MCIGGYSSGNNSFAMGEKPGLVSISMFSSKDPRFESTIQAGGHRLQCHVQEIAFFVPRNVAESVMLHQSRKPHEIISVASTLIVLSNNCFTRIV